ncbi:MAG: DUF4097 family beta strand repeat protein [Thermoplasmatales archaeon]|nr:MAG: DUF4097 family beta strand repeat protein [Thermoplasmatales archaeon]
MKTKFLVSFLAFIITFIIFSGCININVEGYEVKEFYENEYQADNQTILTVSTVNGLINVVSWDEKNISLNATKRSRYGYEDLDKAKIIVTEINNEITIEIQHDQPIRSRAVDLEIKIPKNVTVKSATTTNGPITLSKIKGDTILSSINGAINIEDVDGYINASSTNGCINIKNTSGIDDLSTTNGGIIAEVLNIIKNIKIQTINGEISLYINQSLNAEFNISTINGGIIIEDLDISTSETSSKHLRGTIGSGGNTLEIKTTNGVIKLFKLE